MTTMNRYRKLAPRGIAVAALVSTLALGACDLELTNPNAPSEEEVINDTEGLIALGVGIQSTFASQFDEFIQASALTTDEWGTGSRSLLSYRTLFVDTASFDPAFGVVEEPFGAAYSTVREANTLIANVPSVIQSPGFVAGLVSLGELFKAMAYGMIIQQYEQVPIKPGGALRPRGEVLDTVIALLESARTRYNGVTADQLAEYNRRVLPDEFDQGNTIDAMLARYYLMRAANGGGNPDYQNAIDAADRVDLTVHSRFAYPAPTSNPIYGLSVALEYVFPLQSFVTEAEAGDDRTAYWVDVAAAPFAGNPADTMLLPLARYNTPNAPIDVYIPDEMRLIQAEAYARMSDLPSARTLINEVRTAGAEPFANLPAKTDTELATLDDVLAQIAYERRYELYMQGLRWEDTRRLDAYIDEDPTLPWLPIPRQECLTNPNVTC